MCNFPLNAFQVPLFVFQIMVRGYIAGEFGFVAEHISAIFFLTGCHAWGHRISYLWHIQVKLPVRVSCENIRGTSRHF